MEAVQKMQNLGPTSLVCKNLIFYAQQEMNKKKVLLFVDGLYVIMP